MSALFSLLLSLYAMLRRVGVYSQLQMSADKSWDRGAALSLSAARIQRDMQDRDTEEKRAAVPTLVCGHLELTICDGI
ncbi:hypothetical protein Y032_0003g1315 [Ancylostoma ceylanicum]|uniref:Uncharacterized protein n=1 Tax=Ancylostoma ceylanicum TaxID=53326 RepID=A0A016VWF2_9BILA|nr:hypothetical protein Y032_0003g1315 [Ancylostoma ceylanicum]